MIRELKPLLSSRALTFTLASIGDNLIRINIFPTKLGKEENRALSEPLSVEGTAEQLDAELPSALVEYVATHLTIRQSLDRIKAEMEAAEKEAKEDASAKKAKLQGKKSREIPEKEPRKPKDLPEPLKPASLFDVSPNEKAVPEETSRPQPVQISEQEIEDEILAELNEADEEAEEDYEIV